MQSVTEGLRACGVLLLVAAAIGGCGAAAGAPPAQPSARQAAGPGAPRTHVPQVPTDPNASAARQPAEQPASQAEDDALARADHERALQAEREGQAFADAQLEASSGLSAQAYELRAGHLLSQMDNRPSAERDALRDALRRLLETAHAEHPEHERIARMLYELRLADPGSRANAQALAERFARLAGTDARWPLLARAAYCASEPSAASLAARLLRDGLCPKPLAPAAARALLERLAMHEPYALAEQHALAICAPAPR